MAGEQMRFQQLLKTVQCFWIRECALGVHSTAWLLHTETFFRQRWMFYPVEPPMSLNPLILVFILVGKMSTCQICILEPVFVGFYTCALGF